MTIQRIAAIQAKPLADLEEKWGNGLKSFIQASRIRQ